MTTPTTPLETLTAAQRETVETYQGYGVPATWFVGAPAEDGTVEVIALGEGFAWSLLIAADGDCNTSEAELGGFSTGIVI